MLKPLRGAAGLGRGPLPSVSPAVQAAGLTLEGGIGVWHMAKGRLGGGTRGTAGTLLRGAVGSRGMSAGLKCGRHTAVTRGAGRSRGSREAQIAIWHFANTEMFQWIQLASPQRHF